MRQHVLLRTFFNSYNTIIYGQDLINHGKLTVSNKSYVGADSKIQIYPGTEITIGKSCGIRRSANIITLCRIASGWINESTTTRYLNTKIVDNV